MTLLRVGLVLLIAARFGFAASSESWAGEYSNKKVLNGSATFQLTIEQSQGRIQVSFDAVNNDGQGCALEAQSTATVSGKDKLQFNFRDSEGNAGTGAIARAGESLVLSVKITKVVKPDCARFYRDAIRLTRVK